MASVNMFTAVVQDIPKKALEWTLGDFDIQEADLRSNAKTQQGRGSVVFGRNLADSTNAESARGTVRGGWAGIRADRLRNDKNFAFSSIESQMRQKVAQLGRNRTLATLGYTL